MMLNEMPPFMARAMEQVRDMDMSNAKLIEGLAEPSPDAAKKIDALIGTSKDRIRTMIMEPRDKLLDIANNKSREICNGGHRNDE